jgi:5-oxoprolinase (ATP-hydrolysing) subunit A
MSSISWGRWRPWRGGRDHRITHMNPHGALGNLASADPETAAALVRATRDFDPDIAFLVLPGSALEQAALAEGSPCARVFLADGPIPRMASLRPAAMPGAVIHDPAQVVARVLRVIREQRVDTLDGSELAMPVQSILIHSDTAGAVDLARRLHHAIRSAGETLCPLSRQG